MPETLVTLLEWFGEHPWAIGVVPAFFVVMQLAVWGPRNARQRRRMNLDREVDAAVRDVHAELDRRARDR